MTVAFRTGSNPFLALALALALTAAGCNPFRRKKTPPPIPPPPPVQQPVPAPTPPPAEPKPTAQPTVQQPPDTETIRLPEPAPKPVPQPKPAPVTPPAPPEPPPGPAPQLGQLLSADEQVRYTRLTDQALARARSALLKIEGRRLTAEQKAALDRVLTFIRQAQELRGRDLVQAAGLAQRADLLARDLAAGVP